MLTVQKGFWEDEYIGAVKHKLEEIYHNDPQIFSNEKKCILEYLLQYENPPDFLRENWQPFSSWFMHIPAIESITRARRAINEEQRNNGQ